MARAVQLLEALNSQNSAPSKRRLQLLNPKTGELTSLGAVLKGRPGVIHLISWPCKPCEREWPKVVQSIDSIAEAGLVPVIIGLTPRESALELVERYEQSAQGAETGVKIVISTDDSLLDAYRLTAATPQTFLVDGRLQLVGKQWVGEKSELWKDSGRFFVKKLLAAGETPQAEKALAPSAMTSRHKPRAETESRPTTGKKFRVPAR